MHTATIFFMFKFIPWSQEDEATARCVSLQIIFDNKWWKRFKFTYIVNVSKNLNLDKLLSLLESDSILSAMSVGAGMLRSILSFKQY